jgi:hypothetical protein
MFGEAHLFPPSTRIPILSPARGLLVGMRRRFRYRLDPQGRKLMVAAAEETTDDWWVT